MLKTPSPEPCFLFMSVPMHVGRPVLWVEKGTEVVPRAAFRNQAPFILQPVSFSACFSSNHQWERRVSIYQDFMRLYPDASQKLITSHCQGSWFLRGTENTGLARAVTATAFLWLTMTSGLWNSLR